MSNISACALFAPAAQGAGTIPRVLYLLLLEEDLFHLLAAPAPPRRRIFSLASARTLTQQLAEASAQRHAAAIARVGQSRACGFDLHALIRDDISIMSRVRQLGLVTNPACHVRVWIGHGLQSVADSDRELRRPSDSVAAVDRLVLDNSDAPFLQHVGQKIGLCRKLP